MQITILKTDSVAAFANCFYIKAQTLMTNKKINLENAIVFIITGVSNLPLLDLHLTAIKQSFNSVLDIKEALLDVADLHKLEGMKNNNIANPKVLAIKGTKKNTKEKKNTSKVTFCYFKKNEHLKLNCFKKQND